MCREQGCTLFRTSSLAKGILFLTILAYCGLAICLANGHDIVFGTNLTIFVSQGCRFRKNWSRQWSNWSSQGTIFVKISLANGTILNMLAADPYSRNLAKKPPPPVHCALMPFCANKISSRGTYFQPNVISYSKRT